MGVYVRWVGVDKGDLMYLFEVRLTNFEFEYYVALVMWRVNVPDYAGFVWDRKILCFTEMKWICDLQSYIYVLF